MQALGRGEPAEDLPPMMMPGVISAGTAIQVAQTSARQVSRG
jgi:hypothetical protein